MSLNLLKHGIVKLQLQQQGQASQLLWKSTFGKLIGSRRSFAIDLERIEQKLLNQSSYKTRTKILERQPRKNIEKKIPNRKEKGDSFKPNRAVVNAVNEHEGITLTFLGTSAGGATLKRSATSLALEMFDDENKNGSIWLVDCGEGTLLQLAKAGIRMTRIDRIFITHLHLDHVGGLPTLLTSLSNGDSPTELDLYGPPGLYHFIACNIICTCTSFANIKLRIHEFGKGPKKFETLNINNGKNSKDPSTVISIHPFAESHLPIERFTIDPNETNPKLWKVLERSNIEVLAGLLRHSVPCFGYVFKEKVISKKMLQEKMEELGIIKGPIRAWLKSIPFGETITIPAGEESGLSESITINTKEFQELTFLPRKAVILGDTCDSSSLLEIGKDADVLVHEATVTDGSQKSIYNHSTPEMAARFATKLRAKSLILTHLSKRGAQDEDFMADSVYDEARPFFFRRPFSRTRFFPI